VMNRFHHQSLLTLNSSLETLDCLSSVFWLPLQTSLSPFTSMKKLEPSRNWSKLLRTFLSARDFRSLASLRDDISFDSRNGARWCSCLKGLFHDDRILVVSKAWGWRDGSMHRDMFS
jgi:hypothetical protein